MFQLGNSLLCAEYLAFVFFQLFCNVPFGIYQSLFSYPVLWDFVLMSISHLYIIPKDIIKIYFQAGYSGFFYFALAHFFQERLAACL